MKALKRKINGRKLNNLGFTMVEILIAMAILGVVSLTIYSFMMTGSRFYQRSSADADIQSEAQLVANAISDLIIDCEVNISYDEQISNSVNGSGGNVYAQGKTLEISNTNYQFLIFHDGKRLFYLERRPDPANPSVYEAYNIDNAELLAENITAFNVDLSRVSGQGKGKNIVTFTMTYESGGRSYSGNYQVNLRNAVTVSANSVTPQSKEANLTLVTIAPTPITIDVKGKNNPVMWMDGVSQKTNGQPLLLSDTLRQKEFTANSDAVNVGREDIYLWNIEDAEGSAEAVGSNTERKFTIQIAENLSDCPPYFKVTARSTIPNKTTGTYASGEAMVYFKKILGMAVVPTRGVVTTSGKNTMDPMGTAVFNVNFTDYNLTTADKGCTWVLEYKNNVTDEDFSPCTDAGVATGSIVGNAYAVKLGSKANENYSFRLTATSRWDDTWSATYTFGVTELATVPGVNTASRGVEIDVTELFTTGDEAWRGRESQFTSQCPYPIKTITGGSLGNMSGYDVDLFQFVQRDGKLYIYIDYDSVRYAESDRALLIYDAGGVNLQMFFDYICEAGHTHRSLAVNWSMPDVKIAPASPVANSAILIKKGGHQDISFTTVGYNLARKNQIGVYIDGENVNATEFGMMDFNSYLSANYISALGNRYTLIQSGIVRLTAKQEQNLYPTEPIPVKITLESFYALVRKYKPNDTNYNSRSGYNLNAYIANVEGMDLFVKGPSNMNSGSTYNNTTVVYNANADAGSANVTAAEVSNITFVLDQNVQVGNYTLRFHGKEQNGIISYYEMTVNGKTYYYNSTYRCWRPVS